MSDLRQAVSEYIETHITAFHDKRLETVKSKKLNEVLRRKNPYLFRAKAQTAEMLVRSIMDAFLSSQEETLFGDFLERVAIFVGERVHQGYKPTPEQLTGIDLVFTKDGTVYIVEIKSGPNWGNSSQVSKMVINFRDAMTRLYEQYPNQPIVAVNGCVYGKDAQPQKRGHIKAGGKVIDEVPYLKLCGQDFWAFISNDDDFYLDIIEPLGHSAKDRNRRFSDAYTDLIQKFTYQFMLEYCNPEGEIDWEKLVRLVSAQDTPQV